ncbi:MAG: hypothetical protein IT448_01740 [Phycisphaerales bacterium]|nr:hypothetical protein [Phycisphaerales bacterium]
MIKRFIFVALVLFVCTDVWAGVASKALQEGTEYVMKKFGREATEEFGEDAAKVLARRMETLATKYGDDVVVEASKKIGPRVFRLVEEVGEDGASKALKLMARRGDDAVWVVSRPKSFRIFAKYGDDAADAMILHREIAESLIENYGRPMTRALTHVDGQNARRLAMLADEGVLAKVPQQAAVLETIEKYGDKAANWVWRNKGAIMVGSVATAFVTNPEAFINGAEKVIEKGGEWIIQPVAEAAANSLNWNLIVIAFFTILAILLVVWWLNPKRRAA